jgi:hypothetical protein
MTGDSIRQGLKAVGPYRIVIDTAMILALVGMIWTTSGWVAGIEHDVGAIKRAQNTIIARVDDVEESIPKSSQLPITREAETRINAVEIRTAAQYAELEKRLVRMENKLDRLVESK